MKIKKEIFFLLGGLWLSNSLVAGVFYEKKQEVYSFPMHNQEKKLYKPNSFVNYKNKSCCQKFWTCLIRAFCGAGFVIRPELAPYYVRK